MPAAARVGDHHTCPKCEPGPVPHVGGPILPTGCPSVLIHDMPAARVGDRSMCVGPPDTIVMGEASVLIANKPAARVGDPTSHGGVIVAGCGCVQIGQLAQAIVMRDAAKSGAAFCEECARKKAAEDAKKKKKAKKSPAAKTPAAKTPATAAATPKAPAAPIVSSSGRAIDVQKALDHINHAAGRHSQGRCARFVNDAIVAGGARNYGRGHAYQTGRSMLAAGFHDVTGGATSPFDIVPEPGDVVVFDRRRGHEYGHVAMWNGTEWVSDFHQEKGILVSDAYRSGGFRVYRP